MKNFKKFLRLPLRRKLMLPEALILSAYYRHLIDHNPFSDISPRIGVLWHETPKEKATGTAWDVSAIVEAVCKHTPWESTCLVRGLTAKKMLNRRRHGCTLYMGVAPNAEGGMDAHAWLRCGNLYVTGGEIAKKYTVTTIYGDISE